MELYEQIRREYEHGAGTIRAVSRKLGVHRREVRRALASASYQFGGEAQVDWYEIQAEFEGQPRKTYIFCMRSMASGAAFHRAYPPQQSTFAPESS